MGNEVFDHYSDDEFLKSYMKSPDIYRWAFICDRIRCLLLDEFGGIYCDSDCKPIQSFDLILNKLNEDITFFTGLKPTQKFALQFLIGCISAYYFIFLNYDSNFYFFSGLGFDIGIVKWLIIIFLL